MLRIPRTGQRFQCTDIQNITLDSSVQELGLPLRLSYALERHGFLRISVLVAARADELIACDDISAGAVQLIRAKLSEHGLLLKGDLKTMGELTSGGRKSESLGIKEN